MSIFLKRQIYRSFLKYLYGGHLSSKKSACDFYTFNHCNYSSQKNPFNRKHFTNYFQDKEFNRICVTIIGNGSLGQPRCIGLFSNHKAFLFNCGEGASRILREYEASFHHIKHVFITHYDWSNISGLADIHITHDSYGVHKLSLYGPPGIENFRCLVTANVINAKLAKRDTPYVDDDFEIKSINVTGPNSLEDNRYLFKSAKNEVFSYCIKIFEKPAKLDPKKLVDHDVPLGPFLLKLRNGEDVVLPSGRTIQLADVVDSFNDEEILLVADCPSENFLWPFITNNEFSQYQLPSDAASKVSYVFHFSPPHIIKNKNYQEWMNRFHSKTQHVILNSLCPNISSEAVYKTQTIFHRLHPEVFKLLPKSETKSQEPDFLSPVIFAPPMLQINLRPKRNLNWCNVVNYDPNNYMEEVKYFQDYQEEIKKLNSLIASESEFSVSGSQIYPEVIFLGTSSSTSSAYRNVTALLIKVSSSQSILLDCGESSYQQFVRYFGNENVESELCKISCIFISHLHTDHYLGLFQLIKARIEAFQKLNEQYQPVILILPFKIIHVLKQFNMLFEPLSSKVRIFSCKSLTAKRKNGENLQSALGDIKIETVRVKHCGDSYGIVLEDLKWKIVYSGDSAPCQNLIEAGGNCTLLIHEASIEDGCTNEALNRRHSTPSQVINIAEKMNAKHTIMTHFSKRYLAVPVFNDSSNKSIGCAFDFMKVQLHQLPLVSHFLPATKCLFQEQLEKNSERTSFVVNFENSFLKSYKLKANSSNSSE